MERRGQSGWNGMESQVLVLPCLALPLSCLPCLFHRRVLLPPALPPSASHPSNSRLAPSAVSSELRKHSKSEPHPVVVRGKERLNIVGAKTRHPYGRRGSLPTRMYPVFCFHLPAAAAELSHLFFSLSHTHRYLLGR